MVVSLRSLGLSIKEIARLVPASRGSISVWTRDVVLTEEQRARLAAKRPDIAVRREIGARRHRQRLEEIEAIRVRGRAQARNLGIDPVWVAGVVAYWSEGDKSRELRFANSDPALVRLFIAWAIRFLPVTLDDLQARLHLHSGQDERERILYWSRQTGIPTSRFGKTFVKREGTGHRKKVLYQGTIQIRVRRSVDLLHLVAGWIDGIAASQGAARESPVVYNPRAARAGSSIGRAEAS